MKVRVKICGITRLEDALVAAEAGAHALGFMFYPQSPRCISPEAAQPIIRRLPPFLTPVGVFVDALEETVRAAAAICGLDTLQFHGEESPEYCARFADFKVIKAFRIKDTESLEPLPKYATAAWLLDSFVPGVQGGTGERFNWDLAQTARQHGVPLILAGGLTPENVQQAIGSVHPFGVDVSSGVEAAPGRKDPDKVRRFLASALAL